MKPIVTAWIHFPQQMLFGRRHCLGIAGQGQGIAPFQQGA